MSEEDGALAQQFLNTCTQLMLWPHHLIFVGSQGQQILEQKLNEIKRVRTLIEDADAKTTFLEKFTKQGGIFSATSTPTAPTSTLQPGSLEWIVSKRRDLEQLGEELRDLEEDQQDPTYVLKSFSLNEILLALETSEILSDEELTNRMLIFFTNRILSSEDEDQVSRYSAILKRYSASFVR